MRPTSIRIARKYGPLLKVSYLLSPLNNPFSILPDHYQHQVSKPLYPKTLLTEYLLIGEVLAASEALK